MWTLDWFGAKLEVDNLDNAEKLPSALPLHFSDWCLCRVWQYRVIMCPGSRPGCDMSGHVNHPLVPWLTQSPPCSAAVLQCGGRIKHLLCRDLVIIKCGQLQSPV